MNSKKIEIDVLLFMLIEAVFLLFFFKESLLTNFLGIIFGVFFIILTKNVKKNKYTKLILFTVTLFFLFGTFTKIISFIHLNILKNYPLFIIIIPMLSIAIYLTLKKYHTFIRATEISFYFFIFIKFISLLLIIPKIEFANIFSLSNLSFSYHFIFIGLTILYLYKIVNYLTAYSINKKRIIFSLINPLFIQLITILVLGNTLFNIYQYPYVNYLKTIKYFDFIERIDGILSFEYLLCFFYLFVFLLISIKLLYKSFNNQSFHN